jgi:hypothetical protein
MELEDPSPNCYLRDNQMYIKKFIRLISLHKIRIHLQEDIHEIKTPLFEYSRIFIFEINH